VITDPLIPVSFDFLLPVNRLFFFIWDPITKSLPRTILCWS